MSELYLIAHKVRGQPAFDIAERMSELDEGDELGWIIPTSGHRAHPYWYEALPDLIPQIWDDVDHPSKFPSADLPDHYPTTAEPRRSPTAGRGLLARLGLLRAQAPIKRRV